MEEYFQLVISKKLKKNKNQPFCFSFLSPLTETLSGIPTNHVVTFFFLDIFVSVVSDKYSI